MHEKEWLTHSSSIECQSRNPRRRYSKRRGSGARYCVKQHNDLDQERLYELPVAPRYCIDAQGSSKHTDLEIFTPQICVRCCAKASYTPSPTVRVKRPAQRASWRAVAQRFIQRAKAGGRGWECATAHMACQHDNVQPSAGTASWRGRTAHAWSESPLTYSPTSLSCSSSAVSVFLRRYQEARRDNVSPD